ncbi:MAG: tail fiber domain-containing protein [Chitinophagaceae bacterium]
MGLKFLTFLFLFCLVGYLGVAQQKTYQIKADTVRVFNNCDTAELVLENRTKGILNGVLTNKGKGVTEFRKVLTKINACTYLIGGDSLKLDECNANNSGSMAWLLNGNTVGAIKTLGTIDNFDLPFITNNAERMRITSIGNVGIGTVNPDARLHVKDSYIYSTALHVEGNSWFDGYIRADTRKGFTGLQFQDLTGDGIFRINAPVSVGYTKAITIDQPSMSMLFQHGNSNHGGAGIVRPYIDGSEFRIFSNKTGANQEYPGYITFFADDVERMRIATNSNVGIGTTTPDAKLHVKELDIYANAFHAEGNSRFDGNITADTRNGFTGLQFQDLNMAASVRITPPVNIGYWKTITIDQPSMSLLFRHENEDIGGGIRKLGNYVDIFNESPNSNQGLKLSTAGSTRMLIDYLGNVGIGTTSPAAKLHTLGTVRFEALSSGTGNPLVIDANGNVLRGAGAGNNNAWGLGGNNVGAIKTIGTVDNFDLPFVTNNIERLRVTADGNMLVNTTTNNGSKLQVNGQVTSDSIFSKSILVGNRRPTYIYNYPMLKPQLRVAGSTSTLELSSDGSNLSGYNLDHQFVFSKSNASKIIASRYPTDSAVFVQKSSNFPSGTQISFYIATDNQYAGGLWGQEIMDLIPAKAGSLIAPTVQANWRFTVGSNTADSTWIDLDARDLPIFMKNLPTASADTSANKPLVIQADGSVRRSYWQTMSGTPSDFYLKENITASNFNSSKLLNLAVKDFNYKNDVDKIRYTGLIAQELKKIIPELVLGKEGNYSIDYQKMVPYLLKAVQDQQELILQQQKDIEQLKQQQNNLNKTMEEERNAVNKLLEEIKLLKAKMGDK